MSYSIYIGEAEIQGSRDDDYITIGVRPESHPNTAPTFSGDAMTGCTNARHPGYRSWTDFCVATGLHDAFFTGQEPDFYRDTPVMAEHPGRAVLSNLDYEHFSAALVRYRAANPNVTPGFGRSDEAAHLARLEWLCYWTGWAVRTCEWPVLVNT